MANEWDLMQEEIDELWTVYEKENPDQGGLDTWDKRLIKLAQRKLVEWFNGYRVDDVSGLPCFILSMNEWQTLKKEVGL